MINSASNPQVEFGIFSASGLRSNLHYSITNCFLDTSTKIINIDCLRCKLHPPTPVPDTTHPPIFQHLKERLVRLIWRQTAGLAACCNEFWKGLRRFSVS